MLLSRKKITEDLIEMMMGWRHSEFNVYYGPRIKSGEEEAMNPRSFKGPLKTLEYSINYSHRGVGPYGPEAMSQFPVSDNLSKASRSNEWLYVDPKYPETFPS